MYHVEIENGTSTVKNIVDLKLNQFATYGGDYILILDTYKNGVEVYNFSTKEYESIEGSNVELESCDVKRGDLQTTIRVYGDFKEVCTSFDEQLKKQGFKDVTVWAKMLGQLAEIKENF